MKISYPIFIGKRRGAKDGDRKFPAWPWLHKCCFAAESPVLRAPCLLCRRRLPRSLGISSTFYRPLWETTPDFFASSHDSLKCSYIHVDTRDQDFMYHLDSLPWFVPTDAYSKSLMQTVPLELTITLMVSGSISASTPACHAGERGSTPRQRDYFFPHPWRGHLNETVRPGSACSFFPFPKLPAPKQTGPLGDYSASLQACASYETRRDCEIFCTQSVATLLRGVHHTNLSIM